MEKSSSAINKENHESPMPKCMCAHARAAGQPSLGAGARLTWVLAKSLPPSPVDLGDSKKFLEWILTLGLFAQSALFHSSLGLIFLLPAPVWSLQLVWTTSGPA